MANRSLVHSPLTLLLLIALFNNKKVPLNISTIGVYEAFIELSCEEWQRRGLVNTLGKEIGDYAVDIMAMLAWYDISGSFDEDEAIQLIGEFIALQTGRRYLGAERAARSLFGFLSDEGGFFRIVNNSVFWIHQNIRDFLAARSLSVLREEMPRSPKEELTRDLGELVAGYWDDASRESFIRFALCMCRDTQLRKRVVELLLQRENSSLAFISRAVSDGAEFDSEFSEQIADSLFSKAAADYGMCQNVFTSESVDPVRAFMLIAWKEPFFRRACSVLRGELRPQVLEKECTFRMEIAATLAGLCSATQLSELSNDFQIRSEVRAHFEKTGFSAS